MENNQGNEMNKDIDFSADRNKTAVDKKEEMARRIAQNMAKNFGYVEQQPVIRSSDEPIAVSESAEENEPEQDTIKVAAAVAVADKPVTKKTEYADMTTNTKKRPAPTAKSAVSAKSKKKKSKKKKSSTGKVVAIVCGSVVGVLLLGFGGVYAYGKSKYVGKFLPNTYINGVEVSGKTEEEAYPLVLDNALMPTTITLQKLDGSDVTIDFSEIGYSDNVQTTINQFYSQQNHSLWFSALSKKTDFEFTPESSYDDAKLNAVVKRKVIDGQTVTEAQNAKIEKTDDGYAITPEVLGDAADEDQLDVLYEYINSQLDECIYTIDLSNADCYQKPSIVSADLQDECDKLNKMNDIEINFDFVYATETLKGDRIMDWIEFKEDGTYTVNQDDVVAYVKEIGDKYNTYRVDRQFKSTNRGTITVEGGEGIYGWWLDDDQMAALITSLVEEGASADATPIYYQNPNSGILYEGNEDSWTADDDIGDTYLELDLTAQHMWYYKDGKMVWETDVVSGKPTETRNTPEGVYKLWFKAKDFRLKDSNADGSSWDTKVAYWNNISNCGIGIHDATWQPGFGGDIYTWNGSHGCINVSLDAAKYVYENIELNTPVVAYWTD